MLSRGAERVRVQPLGRRDDGRSVRRGPHEGMGDADVDVRGGETTASSTPSREKTNEVRKRIVL